MPDQSPLEARLADLSEFIGDGADAAGGAGDASACVSLVYPSPDVLADTRKWDIAQKNILSRLSEETAAGSLDERAAQKLSDWVEKMEPDHLPEGGFALYADEERLAVHELDVRPLPTLSGGTPFALPALVDAAGRLDYVVVALDAETPRLFTVSNGAWTDITPDDAPSLSGEMANSAPMATINFHSSGRPHVGSAAHAASKFHALGTSTDEQKRKEIERVFRDFAGQVTEKLSGRRDPVLLVGDPKNCGVFRERFDHPALMEKDVHAGGDALELRELAGRAREAVLEARKAARTAALAQLDRNTLRTDPDDLAAAAREGRVEHVYLREDAAGLLQGDDERLKLDAGADERTKARSATVALAVKNGAGLTVFTQEEGGDLPELAATMRY